MCLVATGLLQGDISCHKRHGTHARSDLGVLASLCTLECFSTKQRNSLACHIDGTNFKDEVARAVTIAGVCNGEGGFYGRPFGSDYGTAEFHVFVKNYCNLVAHRS